MGAGKSTIGRLLAVRLQFAFFDTDAVIEERTGADIPWIFDVEGETGFRDREAAVLKDLIDYSEAVIATGGGIVIRAENRETLSRSGKVVYLTASIDQLVDRTCKDKKRPLLQVDDPRKKITSLIIERDPLYRAVATDIVETGGRSPKNVVQEILDFL